MVVGTGAAGVVLPKLAEQRLTLRRQRDINQNTDYQELMKGEGAQIASWVPFAVAKNSLFTTPVPSGIGEAHVKSVAQVVLR